MTFVCKATFVAYALLSSFGTITKKDRDAVRYVLELLSSYDIATQELLTTHDMCVLAGVYLPQLRTMALRHSYEHRGSLKNDSHAHMLLSVIVTPLIRHVSPEQYRDIVDSVKDANTLLSMPMSVLNELVASWRVQHLELVLNWRSFPISGTNTYSFGCTVLRGFRIEDVLTPLPYPISTSSRLSMDGTSKAFYTESTEAELGDLKSGASGGSFFHFARTSHLAMHGREVRSSVYSDSSSIQNLPYIEAGSQGELLAKIPAVSSSQCSCHDKRALCFIHERGHPSEQERKSTIPSGRRIVRCMRSKLRALSLSI
ncbi:hypothetical protein FRC09_005491 [Ceratobasidium sp. 395]|nr:hypothetical protein FRC09_005491 [Ceratobasidium sp. 395]